jgi:hypothetical protein
MEKNWKFTTFEDGQPVASYNLANRDAAKAIDWIARGGNIEDLIRAEQPVEIEVQRTEKPAEVRAAA